MPEQQQPQYQTVRGFRDWPVLGSFNNWNIISLSHKATPSEEIYSIHTVLICGISENMASLVRTDKYYDINTKDTTTM